MFSVAALNVSLASRYVLRDVTVDVRPGEVLALLGASGAGKSTLLKVLCGDISPLRGSLTLDGQPLQRWSPRQQARKRAFVMQASPLDFRMTVLELVMMGRNPHRYGQTRQHDYAISYAALAETDSQQLANCDYLALRYHEQRRVQLARALAQVWEASEAGARYLFIDTEPQDNSLPELMPIICRAAARGLAVVITMPDVALAKRYADQVLMLHQGRVLAQGQPASVLSHTLLQHALAGADTTGSSAIALPEAI